jgi:3'(2'), 5'-bisphosphate nucleotidase
MTAQDDSQLLEIAARLAWQAAEIVLGIRARGYETQAKADATPVTEADHLSEAAITAGLRAATPDIPVIAEEEIAGGYMAPRRGRAYWLVDPLDGTRDFVAMRDSFTVNIGLIREGRPVLGVVAVPASAELFGGLVGAGAWKQDASGRRRIVARPVPRTGLTVLASRLRSEEMRIRALAAPRQVASITLLGSALKFCRLAEGAADFYPRFGRTMEWDTAGPEAILTAAGGRLRLLDGSVMRYEKPEWVNPPFLCWGAEAEAAAASPPGGTPLRDA